VLGSYQDRTCRTRTFFGSSVLEGEELYYSYGTCGEVDLYAEDQIISAVAGRTFTAVVSPSTLPPWVVKPELVKDTKF